MDIGNLDYLTAVEPHQRSQGCATPMESCASVKGGFSAGGLQLSFTVKDGKVDSSLKRFGTLPFSIDGLGDWFPTTLDSEQGSFTPDDFQSVVESFSGELPEFWSLSGKGDFSGSGAFAYGAAIVRV